MNQREIIRLESVDSTNLYAASLLQGGDVPDGTVVWAGAQTAGRGQHENRWESQPGMNLTFSLIIHPKNLSPERQFLINKAIALGTLDYLRLHLPDAGIKWPHDRRMCCTMIMTRPCSLQVSALFSGKEGRSSRGPSPVSTTWAGC